MMVTIYFAVKICIRMICAEYLLEFMKTVRFFIGSLLMPCLVSPLYSFSEKTIVESRLRNWCLQSRRQEIDHKRRRI
jgi:hypothetical protein